MELNEVLVITEASESVETKGGGSNILNDKGEEENVVFGLDTLDDLMFKFGSWNTGFRSSNKCVIYLESLTAYKLIWVELISKRRGINVDKL